MPQRSRKQLLRRQPRRESSAERIHPMNRSRTRDRRTCRSARRRSGDGLDRQSSISAVAPPVSYPVATTIRAPSVRCERKPPAVGGRAPRAKERSRRGSGALPRTRQPGDDYPQPAGPLCDSGTIFVGWAGTAWTHQRQLRGRAHSEPQRRAYRAGDHIAGGRRRVGGNAATAGVGQRSRSARQAARDDLGPRGAHPQRGRERESVRREGASGARAVSDRLARRDDRRLRR